MQPLGGIQEPRTWLCNSYGSSVKVMHWEGVAVRKSGCAGSKLSQNKNLRLPAAVKQSRLKGQLS